MLEATVFAEPSVFAEPPVVAVSVVLSEAAGCEAPAEATVFAAPSAGPADFVPPSSPPQAVRARASTAVTAAPMVAVRLRVRIVRM